MSSLLACRTNNYSVLIPVGYSHALDQDLKTERNSHGTRPCVKLLTMSLKLFIVFYSNATMLIKASCKE